MNPSITNPLLVCFIALLISVFTTLIGSVDFTIYEIFTDPKVASLFWYLRVPRALCAFICGAGLAVAGLVTQSLYKNILATPYTLGVASGATCGAVASMVIAQVIGFEISIFWGGLVGILSALIFIFLINRSFKDTENSTILLIGIGASILFSNLTALIQYASNSAGGFVEISQWMVGSIPILDNPTLYIFFLVVLTAALIFLLLGRSLDLLAVGDEFALSKGVSVKFINYLLLLLVSLLVGGSVIICGPIGFIGLIEPYICRIYFGSYHRRLVVLVFFIGGAYLTVCDCIARTVFSPLEMPVGFITGTIGVPFFIWAIVRSGNRREGIN